MIQTLLGRGLYLVWTAPVRPVWWVGERIALSNTVIGRSDGFEVHCGPELRVSCRDVVERVISALALIQLVDNGRFERIRSDMPRFLVRKAASAQYWLGPKICLVALDNVLSRSEVDLALTIVHEATHARIVNSGIGWWPDLFERIERRCIRSEIAFCRRLALAGYRVSARIVWYEERLTRPVYSRQLRKARRIRAAKLHGLPSWVQRLMKSWP